MNLFHKLNFQTSLLIIARRRSSIYALASGSNQRSAVAVIRISGKKCLEVLQKLTRKQKNELEPRKMYLRDLYHSVENIKIDKSLVVWFKAPNSFTGEDVAELHVHGGPAVISSVLDSLSKIDGLKLAEPGEFSRRAFFNGKMDLTEIEGLADLINAETEMQRRQALNQMNGFLSNLYNEWRNDIIKVLANVEAYIDFHEEENIEDDVLDQVNDKLAKLKASIESHLKDNRLGERLRSGIRVVIVGEPNAGKSSLLNNICQRPAAIVSPIPGTTRDIIESSVNIGGYPVLLSDTAGLRETSDFVEEEGVRRAKERIDTADILIVVIDSYKYLSRLKDYVQIKEFLNEHFTDLMINKAKLNELIRNKTLVVVFNKSDLIKNGQSNSLNGAIDDITISDLCSLEKDQSVKGLMTILESKLKFLFLNTNLEMPLITQQRHRDNLLKCIHCINSYMCNDASQDFVLKTEELRNASKYLGKITGQILNEEILDVIFKDFCIGK